jgi:hypothetical protein
VPRLTGYQKFTDAGSPKDAIRYLRFAGKTSNVDERYLRPPTFDTKVDVHTGRIPL